MVRSRWERIVAVVFSSFAALDFSRTSNVTSANGKPLRSLRARS